MIVDRTLIVHAFTPLLLRVLIPASFLPPPLLHALLVEPGEQVCTSNALGDDDEGRMAFSYSGDDRSFMRSLHCY